MGLHFKFVFFNSNLFCFVDKNVLIRTTRRIIQERLSETFRSRYLGKKGSYKSENENPNKKDQKSRRKLLENPFNFNF